MLKRFKHILNTWKPIPLCWWYMKRGKPIPRYFVGTAATAPSVTTNAATAIANTSVTGNGNVTSDGGASITERGFVHSIKSVNSNPLINGTGVTKTVVDGTTGAYSETLASLAQNTLYTYKAYAINSKGTSYGAATDFTTKSLALTGTITNDTEIDIRTGGSTIILTLINDTWVTSGATFDAQRQNIINGIDSAQSEGTGWDAVVKAGLAVTDVARTSNTVVTITLPAFATYNITANEIITATVPSTALTGAVAMVAVPTFTINAVVAPTVTTQAVSNIGSTTATGNGNATADGGATITEKGVVLNTTGTPTTSDIKWQSGMAGTGSFGINITSLSSGTHYYVRAYAINAVGTSYGSEVEFDTLNLPPTTVLNTPADEATGVSVTPTLEFTGTDANDDDVRYNVQVRSGPYWPVNLQDDFNDNSLDTSKWEIVFSDANGSITESSGALRFNATADDTTQQLWSVDVLNLQDSYLSFEIPDAGASGVNASGTTFTIDMDTGGGENARTGWSLFFNSVEGVASVVGRYNKTTGGNTTVFTEAYSPTNHRWIRIRETSGTLYYERSSDGISWNEMGNISSADINLNQRLKFSYDSYGTDAPDSFVIDNFNVGPLIRVSGTDSGFANTVTGGDTDPFNSGEKADYDVQAGDELDPATEYFWRVRAIDPDGSNTYGEWSAVRSFTTESGEPSVITPRTLNLLGVGN